jgi:endonuclease-3
MNRHNCYKIFELLATHNPLPKAELNYATPFQLLIAAVFSAQSTDIGVNRITQQLFLDAPTPETMLALGNEKLTYAIHSLGLYHNKAKNAIGICHMLIDKYNGEIPSSREALESLPGVGRKTANIILNIIFGQPVIAVDTHVFRVANRTGIASGKKVREVEDNLMKTVPFKFRQNAHHWLVLHGRYTCRAQKPHCKACIIVKYCEYPDKNLS